MGADARTASAERGEEGLALLVEHVASIVHAYLSAPEGGSDPPG